MIHLITHRMMLAFMMVTPCLQASLKDIKGLEEENIKPFHEIITIQSATDRSLSIPIPRTLAREKSSLLRTLLENEPNTKQITLPPLLYTPAIQFFWETLQNGMEAAKLGNITKWHGSRKAKIPCCVAR